MEQNLIKKTLDFQVVTVYNESKFPAPLSVQVLDAADNICKQADVKVQIAKDPKLKVINLFYYLFNIFYLLKMIQTSKPFWQFKF